MKHAQGFTLVELMVAISVLAIGLTIGIPSFQSFIEKNRSNAFRDRLYASLMLARSEAAKQGTFVSVCPSSDQSSCTASSDDWSNGWIVFVDANGDGSYSSSNDEILRVAEGINGDLSLTWTATDSTYSIRYDSQGFIRDGDGEFSLCPSDGDDQSKRGLKVGPTGRPHVTTGSNVTCS